MNDQFRYLNLVLFCLVAFGEVHAQGTAADYKRAVDFGTTTRNTVFYSPSSFSWLEGEHRFWYVNNTPEGRRFMLVDADKQTKNEAFDHAKIAAALTLAAGKQVSADSLPFTRIGFKSADTIEFESFDKIWYANLVDYTITDTGRKPEQRQWGRRGYWGDSDDGESREIPSPDSNWVAYIKNYNVFVRPTKADAEEIQLSYDGALGYHYSSRIAWSPDSEKLAVTKVRTNTHRKIYFVESSPSTQLQPMLQERNYLKQGDAMPQYQPVLRSEEKKSELQSLKRI